jgi:hypothetical protein
MAGNSKNFLPVFPLITNANMASPITSPATDIRYLDDIGVQLTWTGTPTGTFSVNVSTDKINWVPLTLPQSPVASGAPGSIYIDIFALSAPYIQVTYSGTGAGVLNCNITAKAI